LIDNDLSELLLANDYFILDEIDYQTREDLLYLIDKEYGFIINKVELDFFPKLNLEVKKEIPNILSNIIIDIDKNSVYNLKKLSYEIRLMRIHSIELRIFDELSKEMILDVIDTLSFPELRTINLICKYSNDIDKEVFSLLKEFPVIRQIIFHSSHTNSINPSYFGRVLIHSQDKIIDESHCGNISPSYFEANMTHFNERNMNNCLSGKISVDKEGNIKNCPSLKTNFGSINDTTLSYVTKQKHFYELWRISKNKIETCKVCEFRHICIDCRAYTENNDLYSKPLKCNYDPYKGIWSE
jgi:SPASM domain peptide maturase of grasp-with-spasm system